MIDDGVHYENPQENYPWLARITVVDAFSSASTKKRPSILEFLHKLEELERH